MVRAIPLAMVLSLALVAPALADIPPPPYTGPTHATVAGLDFERGEGLRPPGRPGRRSYAVVKLKSCHGASRNCAAVTRAGVIGWGVVKVDGQWLSYGDVGELRRIFSRGRAVRVTLEDVSGAAEPRPVDVVLGAR